MEFIKKNKVIFIVAALIILFVVSIVLTPKATEYLKDNVSVAEWKAASEKDEYTIVTLAQTTCSHCVAFKPYVQKFVEKYDVNWYWIEVNLLEEKDYNIIGETFEDFTGTPYTAIMKKGKILNTINGEVEYKKIAGYLEDADITLVERTTEE